jgi:hypothetical protein
VPSPAILVAVLALVAALAGTAVAEQATTSVSKKTTRQIANKQINKMLPIGASEFGNIVERSEDTTIPAGTNGTAEAACNQDEKLISGGWRLPPPTTDSATGIVYADLREDNPQVHSVGVRAIGADRTITVFAYCLQR